MTCSKGSERLRHALYRIMPPPFVRVLMIPVVTSVPFSGFLMGYAVMENEARTKRGMAGADHYMGRASAPFSSHSGVTAFGSQLEPSIGEGWGHHPHFGGTTRCQSVLSQVPTPKPGFVGTGGWGTPVAARVASSC